MISNKTDFIAAAILDIQATIRSLDTKSAALLVVILTPFANIKYIFIHLEHFNSQLPHWLSIPITAIFLFSWIFALISFIRTIGPLNNPSSHIENSTSYKGSFYAPGLYDFKIIDVFFNRNTTKASLDPQAFKTQRTPNTIEEIDNELVFEQMKLAYIRDIKLNRLIWGMRFSLVWFILGIIIFVSSKYLMQFQSLHS